MRVLHLIFSLGNGGAENLLVDIINQQVKYGSVGLLIVNDKIDPILFSLIDKKIKVYTLLRKEGTFTPHLFLKMNFIIMKFSPTVIHCHNENIVNCLFFSLRRKAYLTVHDTKVELKYLSKYRHLFAISRSVQKYIRQEKGLPSQINYNGIQVNLIKQREGYFPSIPFRIVQISRLMHEKKGQHLLLNAIARLNAEGYCIQADFIGEGESRAYLSKLINKLNLQDQVRLLGNMSRKEIYSCLAQYDLLVQPSLYEGFGLTVVEAMAAKVPVLASRIEGPAEIIKDEKFGYLFESNNWSDLALKIKYILDNYKESCMRAEAAAEYVKNTFDVDLTAKRYIDLYQKEYMI